MWWTCFQHGWCKFNVTEERTDLQCNARMSLEKAEVRERNWKGRQWTVYVSRSQRD